jgi:hypothetical protein
MAYQNAVERLSVLSRHMLGAESDAEVLFRQNTKADEDVRPAPGGGRGTLTVLDNRTGKKYTVSSKGCVASAAAFLRPFVMPVVVHTVCA